MRLHGAEERSLTAAALASGSVRELASGLDALYLSGHGEVAPALLCDLADAKAAAEEAGEPIPFELGTSGLQLQPRGFGRHRYWLSHPFGQIGISDAPNLPRLRIQPKSEYLHAVGARVALAWFRDLAAGFTTGLRLTASRVDVFCDTQGWQLRPDDRLHFVTRATRRDMHEESEALTGFEFGRRAGKTVMARLYDKTLDVKKKGTDWWPRVWGDTYDASRPVLRVEFEFGRQGLKQLGVDTAAEALDRAPQLWRYATDAWLSHRVPSPDSTKSRWPVSPQWQQLSAASFAEHAVGLERIQEGKRRGSLRRLMPGLVGYTASAGAWLGAETLEETFERLPQHFRDYGLVAGQTFEERLAVRRRELGAA